MNAAYGKQRQSHIFKKANKTGTCRHVEILATMAYGAWQPSRTHSEADKKAFKRLQAELQAIFLLSGDPFRKEGAQFHPLFELSLPKENWRDTNEEKSSSAFKPELDPQSAGMARRRLSTSVAGAKSNEASWLNLGSRRRGVPRITNAEFSWVCPFSVLGSFPGRAGPRLSLTCRRSVKG